jgi:hypothetical protein
MPPSHDLKRGGKYPYIFSFFYTPILDNGSPAAARALGVFVGMGKYKTRKSGLISLSPPFLIYCFVKEESFFIFSRVDTQEDFEGSKKMEKIQKNFVFKA